MARGDGAPIIPRPKFTRMNTYLTQKRENIIRQLQRQSRLPIENLALLKKYLSRSLAYSEVITFYDWECPPRFIDTSRDGRVFLSFDVDLRKIFQGKKIDQFTEFPCVVENRDLEDAFIGFLNGLGIRYRFVKFIADTNALYLAPESMTVLGKKKTIKKFREFKIRIATAMEQYPARTAVFLFTDVLKRYKRMYNEAFAVALRILERNPRELISEKTLKEQFERTRKHVGLRDLDEIKSFSLRTIASYAAEGIIFGLLTKTKTFSNCIWLNIREADQRTIEITNCLRVKKRLGKLPMIFPKGLQ